MRRHLSDLYPDALPCLRRVRTAGLRVGVAGNMPIEYEDLLRPHVHAVGSSDRWGVSKPSPAFFHRVAQLVGQAPESIAYVGDRVDNDVLPARQAGMLAVHIRRGPWGHLHGAGSADVRLASLDELPDAILQLPASAAQRSARNAQ